RLTLKLARDLFDFFHDPEQVAAPKLGDLLFVVSAANQFERDRERFTRIVPSDQAASAIEIRGNADVIDAEQIYGIIDMVDKIFNGCRLVARILFVNLGESGFELMASLIGPGF